MKRIFSGLVLATIIVSLMASCASGRRGGVGCPGNPTYYRR